MFDRVKINYEDIVNKEKEIINFIAKNSDCFSFVVKIKKPYSQIPPVYNYSDLLNPHSLKYLFYKEDWPIDYISQDKHKIMIKYRCNSESRKTLLKIPSLFSPKENDEPEDICFYRNGKLWFLTISHEKIAIMIKATENDIEFMKKNKVCYYDQS